MSIQIIGFATDIVYLSLSFYMKKTIAIVLAFSAALYGIWTSMYVEPIEELRRTHLNYLQNSPFRETIVLSKQQRKSKGLPPNKYYEREWELTMNPATGMPEPQKVLALQNTLLSKNIHKKSPGDAIDNPWIERGPNNVGGRTRVVMFDPNDSTNKRVFAGGVSGGLWVNDDITNSSSPWSRITNVPGNMAVNCMTYDPNNTDIMYLGTGELYTAGAVTGNGVYKSSDGGNSWELIFGGNDGPTFIGSQAIVPGEYFVQDIIAWNHNGATEVFIAIGASYWRYGGDLTTFLGFGSDFGVYKSVDGGVNWSKPAIPEKNSHTQQPNDFEIAADNSIWLATTGNYYGDAGGTIFKSTDGSTFVTRKEIENTLRTEIEVSSTDPNLIYVLARSSDDLPKIYKTTDAFTASFEEVALPDDADTGIPANDFTRNQAFYNLMIELDPTNDNILYVGGIDLFRSVNGGNTWGQISKWSNNNNLNDLPCALVHADQHAMTFRPGNSNQAVFGNDGGVYYSNSLISAAGSASISAMNTDFNVTQFYSAAIAPTAADEYFIAGSQDNGTQLFNNPNSGGPDATVEIFGGDGAACFVDQEGEDYLIVSYVYHESVYLFDFNASDWREIVSDNGDGDFINQADLDSNLDILYTNGTDRAEGLYRLHRFSGLTSIPQGGKAAMSSIQNPLLSSSPTAIKVSPYTKSSTTLLVGTENGTLLRVQNADNGASWTAITGINFVGSISDIEYGSNENEILVTFHNYGVQNIWYSDDGGLSWQEKEGDFPDIPVKAILQNPITQNEVIIGTELGVWKTENWQAPAPNWVQTYNGMSDVKVTDMQYRKDGHAVLAATYGRGVFTGVFGSNDATFVLSSNNSSQRVSPNEDVVFAIEYEAISGFDENVNLSVANLPSGASASFDPISPIRVNGKGVFELTIDFPEDMSLGTYQFTLQAVAPLETKTLGLQVEVVQDVDGDGVLDQDDNCPSIANPDQEDFDKDGEGDVCDTDDDNDGILDEFDNCPYLNDSNQNDNDEDGEGDVCDIDDDNDGVLDFMDNSPFDYNPDQTDTDNDGVGDASDTDDDNDSIPDDVDNCPLVVNPLQYDVDEDGIGDICDQNIVINSEVPKGFTPNNDGENDVWILEDITEMYPNNKVQIFNRSGQLVFEQSPYLNTFEGVSNIGSSQKLPAGTYMYIIVSGARSASYYPPSYVKKGWIYIKY